MGVKQPHKTRRNGDKRHEDGLNNNRDMTHSSKHETTIFEIQTRDIYVPTPTRCCKDIGCRCKTKITAYLLKKKRTPAMKHDPTLPIMF